MGERYLTIDQVVRELETSAEAIEDQIRRGRINTTVKRNLRFLSDHEVYKLKFIFYLDRKCQLSSEQIDTVLETVSPPYHTWQEQLAAVVE
ncbi:MAG: hypothetical protein WD733_02455 [Bryobacterales bacterium]